MKKITKTEIRAVLDGELDLIELRYGASIQKQFAKSLQLVTSIKSELCYGEDGMDREMLEETLSSLSNLSVGQEAQLETYELADIIGLLANTVLDRKKLRKPLGPLRSTMEALAAVPCIPAIKIRLPQPNRLFKRKSLGWTIYEKFREVKSKTPQYISTLDARSLGRSLKKIERLTPNLKTLDSILAAYTMMYDLALSASKPQRNAIA